MNEMRKLMEAVSEGWPQEETYDEMVEYWKQSLSSSIVRKGVFTQMYDAAGQDIDVLNAAIEDEAHSIAERYHGSGEGIGTSDQNHFIASIAQHLGIDDVFGWRKPKEGIEEEDHYRSHHPKYKGDDWSKDDHGQFLDKMEKRGLKKATRGPLKSDDEMERDKVNRYAKFAKAIRGRKGLSEDAGHSINDVLFDDDLEHFVDDLEYGRWDDSSSYAHALEAYYYDDIPYDVRTGDYGDTGEWIRDRVMQDYGDEIDAITQEMGQEQIAAIRKNAGLSEDNAKQEFLDKLKGVPKEPLYVGFDQSGDIERAVNVKLKGEDHEIHGYDHADRPNLIKVTVGDYDDNIRDLFYDKDLKKIVDPLDKDFDAWMDQNPFESLEESNNEARRLAKRLIKIDDVDLRTSTQGKYNARQDKKMQIWSKAKELGIRDELKAELKNLRGINEAKGNVVEVPFELRGSSPTDTRGATSEQAEGFINELGIDDQVSHDVVDPETGELLFTTGTTKRKEMKKGAHFKLNHDDFTAGAKLRQPIMHGGFDKDIEKKQDSAWEVLDDLRNSDFYNVVWKNAAELVGKPDIGGVDAEDWGDLDYDVDVEVPVAIKRKDGQRFDEDDHDNFREIVRATKNASTMGNFGISYAGTSNKGTVARFVPSFM